MNFPRKEHYEQFVEQLSSVLNSTYLCFYLYGSYIRDSDFVPGRSDLDGGLILNSHFHLPEPDLNFLSSQLAYCLREAERSAGLSPSDPGIKVNFNLMDRGINRDGRFMAYDDTYIDYLKAHARIVSGPDFVQEMNGINYKRESLRSAAYNLRKVRNGLLTYFIDLDKNPERAKKTALSSINLLWSMPKKLLEIMGRDVEFGKGAFFDAFREVFPDYHPGNYEKALYLRSDPEKYFGFLKDMDQAFTLSLIFLNDAQEMICRYLQRFPYPSPLEVGLAT